MGIYRLAHSSFEVEMKYNLKRCSKKEFCKQCRHVKFMGTTTKWPVQKQTHRKAQKHAEHQDVTDIQNNLFCV